MSAFVNTINTLKKVLFAVTAITLTACSGGGGGGTAGGTGSSSFSIGGKVIDGPVIFADVAAYEVSLGATVTVSSTALDTATTDASAKITGLELPNSSTPPYIVEFTTNPGTTLDLSTCTDPNTPTAGTCSEPVISTMRTVVTQEMIDNGTNIYATPLTTMAVNLAQAKAKGGTPASYDADSSGDIDAAEFVAAVNDSALSVTSTLGFGLDSSVDIFTTPPLIDETVDTPEEQQAVADYRTAVAAVAAVIHEMDSQATGDADTVLTELTLDLSDGTIDGEIDTDGDGVSDQTSTVFTETTIQVLEQDPATLEIPGTGGQTVADVEAQLEAESQATSGTSVTLDASVTVEPKPAETSTDIDADGVLNTADAFPLDPTADTDTDGDGSPDLLYAQLGSDANGDGINDRDPTDTTGTNTGADQDDDNDGVADGADIFPLNVAEFADTDGDCGTITTQTTTSGNGCGDNTDTDIDGDGVDNAQDAFPYNPAASTATDADGDGWHVCPIGAIGCLDQDPDDGSVANPAVPFIDTDGDGLADDNGANPDTDDDNDGVADGSDAFPLDASEHTNTDATHPTNSDAIGDNADTDDDGDGVDDAQDAFPKDATADTDSDGDGAPDTAWTDATRTTEDTGRSDSDDDNDGIDDATEDAGAVVDTDGIPNRLDIDSDGDGYLDGVDLDPYNASITINFAPVAADLAVTTDEDVAVTGGSVSATDQNSDALTYSLVGAATNGTAVVNGDGTYTYTPNANFNGTDSFTFKATETAADNYDSNIATVSVTINAVNDAPVIAQTGPLAVTMDEDGSPTAFVAPTISATDAESETLTWSLSSAATNGTASVSGTGASPTVTYAPNSNFNGSDSFEVQVTDGTTPVTITVNVTVDSIDDVPVIAQTGPLAVTMDEDGSPTAFVAPTVSATDIDSGTLTWSLGSAASNGTATVSGVGASPSTLTYVPNANFNGSDSFDVQVTDGSTPVSITVNVTVNSVNDSPEIAQTGPLAVTMDEDSAPTDFVAPTISATDVEAETLTWSLSSVASNGTATVSGTGATPTVDYVPNANFSGSDSFEVQVDDGVSTPATIVVNVTVDPVNDSPIIAQTGPLAVTMSEDGSPTAFAAPTVSATDVEGETLTWSVSGVATNGTATVSGTGASPSTFTYVPNADFSGSDSFTIQVTDGVSTPSTITVDVTVDAVNDSPVIAQTGPLAVTMDEDGAPTAFVAPTVSATDVEAETLTWSVSSAATNGTATVSGTGASPSTFTYVPNANYNGSDSFTIQVTDGVSSPATIVVDMTVDPINDAPIASVDSGSVQPGNTVTIDLITNDSDVDGDSLSVTNISAVTGGTGGVTNNNDGTVTYDAAGDSDGDTVTFTYTAFDGTASSSATTVTVNVTANVSPVIAQTGPLAVTMDEDGAPTAFVAPTVTATDGDVGDTLTWSVSSAASNGTATVSGTGASPSTFTYVPSANFNGSDSFTVQVSDGISTPATIVVDVTVDPINDDPVAVDDPSATATVGTDATINVLANDSDTADGDTLSIQSVGTVSGTSGGSVTNNGTDITYTPGSSNGTDTFDYTISDGNGGTATATVTVTVGLPSDASGVWKLNLTAGTPTDHVGGGCDWVNGDTLSMYVTTSQSGATLTALTQHGAQMTGSIDASDNLSMTGGLAEVTWPNMDTPADANANWTWSEGYTLSTTLDTATTMSGTLSMTETWNSTLQCTIPWTVSGSFVYKHTGSENYDGNYAIELLEDVEEASDFGGGVTQDSGTRKGIWYAEFDFTTNSVTMHSRETLDPSETMTSSNVSFDPNTGFFSFDVDWTQKRDDDGDTVIDESNFETETYTGIMLRDPAVTAGANGAPLMAFNLEGQGRDFSGDYDAGGTAQRAELWWIKGYGKRLDSTTFNATSIFRNGDNVNDTSRVIVGLYHPPLKAMTTTSRLFIEVLDASTTTLCSVDFENDPVETGISGGGKRTETEPDLSDADFDNEVFRTGEYARVSCDASNDGANTITDGDNLTIRVVDTGADGLRDGSGDTVMYTAPTHVAQVSASPYSTGMARSDISVDGASVSTTNSGRLVNLYGYFNNTAPVTVSWPDHADGSGNVDEYILTITDQDGIVHRVHTPDGTTTSADIPADVLSEWDKSILRLQAVKADGSGYTVKAFANRIGIQAGVYGVFNVETDYPDPSLASFQVYLNSGSDSYRCAITNRYASMVDCSTAGVNVDYSTDTVTIYGISINSVSGDLTLNFSDGANATASWTDYTDTYSGNAKVATPELFARSRIRFSSGSYVQDSGLTLRNPPVAYVLGKFGVDDGSPTTTSWNGFSPLIDNDGAPSNDFVNTAQSFVLMPIDGAPQGNGLYVSEWDGAAIWSADTYKFVLSNEIVSGDSAAKEVFKVNYTAPDSSGYQPPTRGQMIINGVTAGTGANSGNNFGNSRDISANPAFDLSWTAPSISDTTNTEWNVVMQYVDGSGNDITNFQARAGFAAPTVVAVDGTDQLEYNTSNSTWTFNNPGVLGLQSGEAAWVQLRTRDANNTVLGISPKFYVHVP